MPLGKQVQSVILPQTYSSAQDDAQVYEGLAVSHGSRRLEVMFRFCGILQLFFFVN